MTVRVRIILRGTVLVVVTEKKSPLESYGKEVSVKC